MAHELEPRVAQQPIHVRLAAGVEVVHAEDVMAARDEPIAQMRPKEARATGHQHAFLIVSEFQSKPRSFWNSRPIGDGHAGHVLGRQRAIVCELPAGHGPSTGNRPAPPKSTLLAGRPWLTGRLQTLPL